MIAFLKKLGGENMKKIILVAGALLLSQVVSAEDLNCQISLNTKLVVNKNIYLPMTRSVSFGEVEAFRFKINNFGNSKFQIEVFDGNNPSRGYADGVLRSPLDQIKWSFWSREILLESVCTLLKR